MNDVDELAVRRFQKREWSQDTTPHECLHTVLAELEQENIKSVVVIGIDAEGNQVTYSAGPHTGTFRQMWLILQNECLRVLDRMLK